MKSSESINELATALVAAQAEMTGAAQDSDNPFFDSKYADITSVLKAVKTPLANNGLSFTQFPITNENQCGVITRLMHSSGEFLEETLLLPMGKYDAQGAGAAITYARRYALQSILGVPAADDDANAVSNPTIDPEEVTACYDKAVELLATGTPADFYEFTTSVEEELLNLAYNRAPKGQISKFKKQWDSRINEFWRPIKAAQKQIPELVEQRSDSGVQEILSEFKDAREKRALWNGLDQVSQQFIENMEES